MTRKEAFEQVFGKHPDFIQSHKTAILGAMDIYARAKWQEACDEMRSEIIGQWDSEAESEFSGINDTIPPKFKP